MNFDFNELLKAFNEHHVKYLIVGGYAFMEYAEPRYTKDLDLWVKADQDNAERVFKALAEFGAPLAGLEPQDFTEEGTFYRVGVPPIMVDILFSLEGLSFDTAWERRHESEDNGILLYFISKDDLITSKLAAGLPQDLLDVQTLQLPVRSADEFQGSQHTTEREQD